MQPFAFHSPTKITFGEDAACGAYEVTRELGGKRTLIVTDANLLNAGVLASVLAAFENGNDSASNQPIIFDEVPPDSDLDCVRSAASLARRAGCDSVLAVGGGSVIDTAKVANICLAYGGDLLDYLGLNNLPTKLFPMVAIPTTAGTGSEVSPVALIRDRDEQRKLLFGSPFLAPDLAILDPKLIVSLPPSLTAATGLDALTHDLESYAALISVSPFSDALCLESMRLIFQFLERATKCADDMEARAATLVASTMAGVAFTNAGVGLIHALAHATGAKYGTHHGMTNAVFLPHGMEFNLESVAGRYGSAARFLGISNELDDDKAARELIKAVRSLVARCGLPTRLKDLGVPAISESELEGLACAASTDAAIIFNPREPSLTEIIGVYKRAY